VKFE
jgi:hypothetical protein